MKKFIVSIFLFTALLGGAVWLTGCGQKSEAAPAKEKPLYTCGMHPQVIQDHPGNCPICGMKLTPIRKQSDAGTNAVANSSAIGVDAVTMQNMNIRTAEVAHGSLRRSIRTVGTIEHSESATAVVT